MRTLRGLAVAGALLLGGAIGAAGASAATEVGNDCEASGTVANATLLPLVNAPANPLPVAVPSSGIATSWKIRLPTSVEVSLGKLKLLRPTGSSGRFRVAAESETKLLSDGENVFASRIPVEAGDRFAIYGSHGTPSCTGAAGDVMGRFNGDAAIGSIPTIREESGAQAAVSALVEPDVDGDGYGDETQDECPQDADYRSVCPTVKLTAHAEVRARSIQLHITASSSALVRVTGQVGWGFKPNPSLKTAGSKPTHLIVGLRGGSKNVGGGQPNLFWIQLPRAVLRRLGRIGPKESLKAKIVISATEPSGPVLIRRLTVKLPGRDGSG